MSPLRYVLKFKLLPSDENAKKPTSPLHVNCFSSLSLLRVSWNHFGYSPLRWCG